MTCGCVWCSLALFKMHILVTDYSVTHVKNKDKINIYSNHLSNVLKVGILGPINLFLKYMAPSLNNKYERGPPLTWALAPRNVCARQCAARA